MAEHELIEPPPPPGTPARRRWLRHVLVLLAMLALTAIGAAWWVLYTQGGARYVFGKAVDMAGEGVRYEGVEGSLGGTMRVKLIEVSRPDLYARVEDVEMDSSLLGAIGGRLVIHRLQARLVEVRTASTGAAAQVPLSFAPPYALRLEEGRIGELRLGALSRRGTDLVVRDILVRGEGDERSWKIDEASAGTQYGSGHVSGSVQTTAPFAVDAKAAFEGRAGERPYKASVLAKGSLKSLEARFEGEVSGQKASGRLVIEPFAPIPVRAFELQARDVDLAHEGAGLQTRLTVDARLVADARTFKGPVRIENAAPGPWDRKQLPFTRASANIVATSERVEVTGLEVELAGGGRASGQAHWQGTGNVQAELRIVDVNLAALHGGLQKTLVAGRVAIEGDAGTQRFDVALKDPRFGIEGRAALAREALDVETVRVTTGGGSVTAAGTIALSGTRDFRFEGRGEHFDPSAFLKTPKGDLNFAFATRGNLGGVMAGEARVDIAPSTYAGLPASGHFNVVGDAHRIGSLEFDVTLAEAHVVAKGALGAAGDAMEFTVAIAELTRIAAAFGLQASGRLEADGRLAGTFADPTANAKLAVANLVLAGTRYESIAATLAGTGSAHRLEVEAKVFDNGLRAAAAGALDARAKSPAWNGRLESLAMTGRGAFALTAPAPLVVSAERVELGEANLKSEFGETRISSVRWTPRTFDAKASSSGIQLQNLVRSLRLEGMPRSTLVLAGEVDIHAAETFEGSVNLRRVSGDLRLGEPPLALGFKDFTVKAESVRGRVTGSLLVTGDRIGRIQGEGTASIERAGNFWALAAEAPITARVQAEQANLEGFATWLGPDSRLAGKVSVQVLVAGTGADPQVSGSVRADNLVVREPGSGFEIENGTVALRLAGRSLAIEKFSASAPWHPSSGARARISGLKAPAGGGRVSAEGAIDLAARTGEIRLKVDQVPVTQLERRFLAISGEARLQASAEGLLATGALKADAGWIGALAKPLPNVSDDVVVVRSAKPAEDVKKEVIRLDLRIGLGEQLYFQGRGLDTRLAGEVRLSGTAGPGLRATGSIRTAGGTYDGYGQKLTIERGVLTFNGPIDNPSLNVLALRKGLPVEAGVEVLGTTTRPKVRIVSSPDVPEPEKLSWLVLGRGGSDTSLGDSAIMVAAARALLGNTPGSEITQKLGFDELRIGRAESGSALGVLPESTVAGRTGTASAADVVSIGRRITDNMHATYEQGLSDAEGMLKLTWNITRQFQLLLRAGYQPGVDAVYRWTFN